jgi:hypothetical protein
MFYTSKFKIFFAVFIQFLFVYSTNSKNINRLEGEEIFKLNENEKECLIINKNLYLYTDQHPRKYPDMTRSVFLWSPLLSRRKPIHYLDEDKQGFWILTPVAGRSDSVYYIANSKYGEYLFAATMKKIESSLSNRRSIFLDRYFLTGRNELAEEHMWEFKKLNNGLYEIWNVKFNERNYLSFYELSTLVPPSII